MVASSNTPAPVFVAAPSPLPYSSPEVPRIHGSTRGHPRSQPPVDNVSHVNHNPERRSGMPSQDSIVVCSSTDCDAQSLMLRGVSGLRAPDLPQTDDVRSTPNTNKSTADKLELVSFAEFLVNPSRRPASVRYTVDELVNICNIVTNSGRPNYLDCQIPVASGLWLENWDYFLQCYWDKSVVAFSRYGWPIGYVVSKTEVQASLEHQSFQENNHRGARDHPSAVSNYLSKETTENRVLGPLDAVPFVRNIKISPLNSVAKRDSHERRIILDCSYPPGDSVNDHIPAGQYLGVEISLTYPSVDQFARLITAKGPGCKLFKRDLKAAYRQFHIDPGDVPLLCYVWQGQLFADLVLAMGLRTSAFICQRLTNAVSYIFHNMGFQCLNYLDDFGAAELPTMADEAFVALGRLLELLGLQESIEKAVSPTTKMSFLGILFDTETMTMSIDSSRLTEILNMLEEWHSRDRATRKEIESLVGHLNFIAKVVRPGRKFMARMFNFLQSLDDSPSHTLDNEFMMDVHWWYTFLPYFNGVRVIPLPCWAETDSVLETDACLSGCGAVNYMDRSYFHLEFPAEIQQKNYSINVLELLCVVVALRVWGAGFAGFRIKLGCDNTSSVAALNEARIHNVQMQSYMREIAFLAAQYDFDLWAVHIPGVNNRLADELSRAHLNNGNFSLLHNPEWSEVTISKSFLLPTHIWK